MHFAISSREDSEGGHISVMIDMRYIWSEIDSPWLIPNRRQPSRLVVFRRSIRCMNGRGEVELSSGWIGNVDRTGFGQYKTLKAFLLYTVGSHACYPDHVPLAGVHWSSACDGVKTPDDIPVEM